MECVDCGNHTSRIYSEHGYIALCDDCADKRLHVKLEEKSSDIQKASDFSAWKHGDMSELFWMHLGKYIKEPNEHSVTLMLMAFRWACHDNQGLANSFRNALKWAKIDLYAEQEKWIEKRRMEDKNGGKHEA